MTEQTRVRTRARQLLPALVRDGQEGYLSVKRTQWDRDTDGPEFADEQRISVPAFEGQTARFKISGGVTINLSNYEFARVDVSLELPCYPERSEIDRTYEWASAYIHQRMESEIAKYRVKESGNGAEGAK